MCSKEKPGKNIHILTVFVITEIFAVPHKHKWDEEQQKIVLIHGSKCFMSFIWHSQKKKIQKIDSQEFFIGNSLLFVSLYPVFIVLFVTDLIEMCSLFSNIQWLISSNHFIWKEKKLTAHVVRYNSYFFSAHFFQLQLFVVVHWKNSNWFVLRCQWKIKNKNWWTESEKSAKMH